MSGFPILDISTFDPRQRTHNRFADDLGEIARSIGFVSIVGHRVDPQLIERGFDVMRRVFVTDMTLEQRLQYEFSAEGRQMGYTPPGQEVSKGRTRPNHMHFWHVNDPRSITRNEFPKEVLAFGQTALAVHATLKEFSADVLRAVAIHLGRDPEFFVEWIQKGGNLLRMIHYPALLGDEDVERSGEHEDIDLMTVLVPATEPGLQTKDPDGKWIDANNPPGSLIVNFGDMMRLHTFDEVTSATHRVVHPRKACADRFSMPMFIHPERSRSLVNAGAYLFRRLREINLIGPLPKNQIDH